MFGRMMNNYYYGKSGKGDYKKEDLPRNRWQLFWEMLRVRFASLMRLNLMTIIAWIPLFIVIGRGLSMYVDIRTVYVNYGNYLIYGTTDDQFTQESADAMAAELSKNYGVGSEQGEQALALTKFEQEGGQAVLSWMFLWMIPCIAILGPVKAGQAYITRNWSRDEHAFLWSDFKDAVKGNWKQALGVSVITGLLPYVLYVGYTFYGQQAETGGLLFVVPQMMMVIIGAVWALACTFAYPMMVTYKVTFKQLLKNSLILALGRLPQTAGIRLMLSVPVIIAGALFEFMGIALSPLILGAYYIVLGYALSRFVTASYTNAVFDKFINTRLEGVKVNRGLAEDDDEDDDDTAEENGNE